MLHNSHVISACLASLLSTSPLLAAQSEPVKTPPLALSPLPMSTGGRMLNDGTGGDAGNYSYQWPGAYFEAAFKGNTVYFKVGPGDEILHVLVDHLPPVALIRPASGLYQVKGLARRAHNIRIEVVTESQSAPGGFGGIAVPKRATELPPPTRASQIKFIGESSTVDYDRR